MEIKTTLNFGALGKPVYDGAVAGNFAVFDEEGGIVDSGLKPSDIASQDVDLDDYVKKSQTAGLLKNDGTVDTNIYLTQHQDITGKADRVAGATNGNIAMLDANGNPADSGISMTDVIGIRDSIGLINMILDDVNGEEV